MIPPTQVKGTPQQDQGEAMTRLPVTERREQLVEAAITVACRDGIDGATLRAIAAEAGVALGVVHYCFQDKDELLTAMAYEITRRNISHVLLAMPVHDDFSVLIQRAIDQLWGAISATPGAQLLTFELTTYSLRHPEVRQVSVNQVVASHGAARQILDALATAADIEWTVPLETLARLVTAKLDGLVLAWLADGDNETALELMRLFGRYLATLARPRATTTAEGQAAAEVESDKTQRKLLALRPSREDSNAPLR